MSIILETPQLFFESSFIHHLSIKHFNIFLLVKKSSMKFDQMTFGRYLSNAICAWNNWLEIWWNCLVLFITFMAATYHHGGNSSPHLLKLLISYKIHAKLFIMNWHCGLFGCNIIKELTILIFWRKANILIWSGYKLLFVKL